MGKLNLRYLHRSLLNYPFFYLYFLHYRFTVGEEPAGGARFHHPPAVRNSNDRNWGCVFIATLIVQAKKYARHSRLYRREYGAFLLRCSRRIRDIHGRVKRITIWFTRQICHVGDLLHLALPVPRFWPPPGSQLEDKYYLGWPQLRPHPGNFCWWLK